MRFAATLSFAACNRVAAISFGETDTESMPMPSAMQNDSISGWLECSPQTPISIDGFARRAVCNTIVISFLTAPSSVRNGSADKVSM